MAYNYGHDVALPGSKGPAIADSFDPDGFKYSITAREA